MNYPSSSHNARNAVQTLLTGQDQVKATFEAYLEDYFRISRRCNQQFLKANRQQALNFIIPPPQVDIRLNHELLRAFLMV